MDAVTPRVCRVITAALIVLAGLLYVVSDFAIAPIFGGEYAAAILPLKLLLPGTLALGIQQVLYADLAGRGHPQIGTFASLIALAATVALDIMLIPRLGIAGAALASSAAYGMGAAFVLASYIRLTGVSLIDTLVVKRSDVTALRQSVAALIVLQPPTETGADGR
jgi:O-antigen/teichoic acid export membrane protein